MKTQDKGAEIKFFDQFDKGSGYDVFDSSGYEKIRFPQTMYDSNYYHL